MLNSYEEGSGNVKLSKIVADDNKFIFDIIVEDNLMDEFEFQGKDRVKSGFKKLDFSGNSIILYVPPVVLENAGIKKVVFSFHKNSSQNSMDIEYHIDDYKTFTKNKQTQQLFSENWNLLKSIDPKPYLIDARTLISQISRNDHSVMFTAYYDEALANFIKGHSDLHQAFTSYMLIKCFINGIYNSKQMDNLTLQFAGQDFEYEKQLTRKQVSDVLCMDKNEINLLFQKINKTYEEVSYKEAYLNKDYSKLELAPKGRIERINGIFKGEKDNRTHHVAVALEYASPSLAFERACNNFLFCDSTSQSIKDGVIAYNHSFEKVISEKKSDYDNSYMAAKNHCFSTIRIKPLSIRNGAYGSYKIWYTKEEKENSKFCNIKTDTLYTIYDAITDTFLTLDDILAPEKMNNIEISTMNGMTQMNATEYALTYMYTKNGKTYRKTIPYWDESCFTRYFLELVGWPETRQKLVEKIVKAPFE